MPRNIEVTQEHINLSVKAWKYKEDIKYDAVAWKYLLEESALNIALKKEFDYFFADDFEKIQTVNDDSKEVLFLVRLADCRYGYTPYIKEIITVTYDNGMPLPFKFILKGFPGRIKAHAKNS